MSGTVNIPALRRAAERGEYPWIAALLDVAEKDRRLNAMLREHYPELFDDPEWPEALENEAALSRLDFGGAA